MTCYIMQHIPRINGSIPTYDDASADHQRLLDRWGTIAMFWLDSLYDIELVVFTAVVDVFSV
jgi:hypothetical protein